MMVKPSAEGVTARLKTIFGRVITSRSALTAASSAAAVSNDRKAFLLSPVIIRRRKHQRLDGNGNGQQPSDAGHRAEIPEDEFPTGDELVGHGDVLIAAITSCTNTSNPSVMLPRDCCEEGVERD
jgi:aconitase A